MCDHHADCIDLDGKYDCRCHIGYAGNGFECINIDECLTNTFLCPSNSGKIRNTVAVLPVSGKPGGIYIKDTLLECKDTEASYSCVCKEGYSFGQFGAACIDNNECLLGTHNCHLEALCANNGGGFYCYCKRGYEDADPSAGTPGAPETGTECIEDNECRDGSHTCPENSYCVNTDASYNCDCYDGYYFGDNICNNINEVILPSRAALLHIFSALKLTMDVVNTQNVSIILAVTRVIVTMGTSL